jgi:hypothetical protein
MSKEVNIFIFCAAAFLIGSFIEWAIVSLAITYGKIVGYRNGVEDTREICYPVLQELKDEVDKCHNCKHYKEKFQ